jgi:hypothetical protein
MAWAMALFVTATVVVEEEPPPLVIVVKVYCCNMPTGTGRPTA